MWLRDALTPHPDSVVGVLSDVVQQFGHGTNNTLHRVGVYEGRSIEELFPAPAKLPRVHQRQRWRFGGIVSEDLVFRSPHEPLEPHFARRYRGDYKETHTVYARRVRPERPGRRPRLLYYHGYMQPETPIEEIAVLATMAHLLDIEVVQIQPPYHGRRTPSMCRFDGEFYWTADVVRSVESLRQSILDARALLGWLLAENDQPVGISGLSLGGALSLALTCLDDRFAFSIPLIAHMDVAALVADAPVLGRMRRELRGYGWTPAEFADFQESMGWNELKPRVPVDRIFLVAASQDRFFRPELVEEMWDRWGRPRIEWYACSHMGFLGYTPQVFPQVRAFIDECVTKPRRRLALVDGGSQVIRER